MKPELEPEDLMERMEPVEGPHLVVYHPDALLVRNEIETPLWKAFGTFAEAKLFFEKQRVICGEKVAIYDADLSRI